MSLDSIDTSYWLTKDKIWFDERKLQWPAIEKVVGLNRKKTEVNVIKQYFLRGKMPKWEHYKNWEDIFRPLPLNFFLWLHPSSDEYVLVTLFRGYIESKLVDVQDIITGYGAFLEHELMRATSSKKSRDEYPFPFMAEKNIIIFRVVFDNINISKEKVLDFLGGQENFNREAKEVFYFLGYSHFRRMRHWLLQDPKSPLSINSLYQYNEVIEWCMTTMTVVNRAELIDELNISINSREYQKALYCFHHFDTEKEGDTCRTRFVQTIRKILDERDFIPEFKKMWQDVKAGKIEVKEPWKR